MIREHTRDGTNARERASESTSPSRERAQTAQDFAVGIGIFILAIAFVFAFLPSVVTPYDTATGGAETAQADRVADLLVEALSTESPNEIDGDDLSDYADMGDKELAGTFGLRTADEGVLVDHVNVTVQELDRTPTGEIDGIGTVYEDQPAASAARIVTIEGGVGDGLEENTPYRLVVRVW
ncbi:DUF7287 family protein [Natronobacterium gregoryi]|uniref:Uncharacterized protein n=2 Tax=Natronobacterium gregoryi TaxID=44930 RepID=L0ACY4_NATGS|nr:hypothetical protein [Natronobacterium gregoryi]AFZ71758.1 hypothetical protein Natgr_0505 [Natronobacterium gregoryi SP2]ELY72857.1 hypothetical protein C490_02511 [Natronobacterium gregoryi SP2]PLK21061.1 hypothetical protein CYV19_06410 [Natronobacterium gregoryi SP2]SFI88513.1 hypothetical protein SAMN05443661_10865 [Natronobacterium gregoryi]